MTAENPNTRRCPWCKAWIALPVRHPMQAFGAHKTGCAERERRERLADEKSDGRYEWLAEQSTSRESTEPHVCREVRA